MRAAAHPPKRDSVRPLMWDTHRATYIGTVGTRDDVTVQSWRRLCCPVDFSDASRTALQHAAYLASALNGELTLVHVPGTADYGRQSLLPETPDLKVAPELRVFAPRCAPMPCSRQGSSLPEKDEGLPGRPGSPRKLCRIWSGKPGSNRRPSAWEADQSAGKARKAQQNDISRLVQSRKIPSGWARPCPNLARGRAGYDGTGEPEHPCCSRPPCFSDSLTRSFSEDADALRVHREVAPGHAPPGRGVRNVHGAVPICALVRPPMLPAGGEWPGTAHSRQLCP
jgi:hypothetical protein